LRALDRNRIVLLVTGFSVLVAAVTGLAWILNDPDAGAVDLATSTDAEDRHKAVERLRGRGSDAARRTLRLLSRDPDKWVAIRAVRALGQDRSRAGRETLAEIIRDGDLAAPTRGEAAATLGTLPDADSGILTEALVRDPKPEVRAGAAKGLLRMRNPKTLPQLVRALEDRDERVRIWAITAIHKMIARRFPYNAKLPPGRQRNEIRRIQAYLRRCGAL